MPLEHAWRGVGRGPSERGELVLVFYRRVL